MRTFVRQAHAEKSRGQSVSDSDRRKTVKWCDDTGDESALRNALNFLHYSPKVTYSALCC